MSEFDYSQFIYFDTNVLSHLAKHKDLWPSLFSFLWDNNLTMSISDTHFSELSQATRIHAALAELFIAVPSAIIKASHVILHEEVHAYPNYRHKTLFTYTLNNLLDEPDGIQQIQNFLTSKKLQMAHQEQKRFAQSMYERHTQLKQNFPPDKSGKYIRYQADKFVENMIIQWLSKEHRDFLHNINTDSKNLISDIFLSIRIFAYVIFYKYYLGQRNPKKSSDFGDLGHVFALPYCKIIVMERDLANILNQIKRNHDILTNTAINTIDFFNTLNDS